MVVGIQTGPGTLAVGVVLLVVGSILAVSTEWLLGLFYRRQGDEADSEPSQQFVLVVRLVGVGVAALGAWLSTGSI